MKEKVHVEGKFRFCPDYFSASASFANMVCPSLIQANIFCYIATSTVFFAFGLLLSSWVQKAPMMMVWAYERFSASTGASCQVFKKNVYRKGFFRYGLLDEAFVHGEDKFSSRSVREPYAVEKLSIS